MEEESLTKYLLERKGSPSAFCLESAFMGNDYTSQTPIDIAAVQLETSTVLGMGHLDLSEVAAQHGIPADAQRDHRVVFQLMAEHVMTEMRKEPNFPTSMVNFVLLKVQPKEGYEAVVSLRDSFNSYSSNDVHDAQDTEPWRHTQLYFLDGMEDPLVPVCNKLLSRQCNLRNYGYSTPLRRIDAEVCMLVGAE